MLGQLIDEHGCARVAREHGLERRRVRRRQAHEARLHARDGARASLDGLARRRRRRTTDPVFGLAVPDAVPDVPAERARSAQHVAGRGRVRRAGEEARRDVPRRTSSKFGDVANRSERGPQGLVPPARRAHLTRMSFEIIRDPLWNNIRVDPLALRLVDTPCVPAAALRAAARARLPRLSRRDATRASSTRSARTTSRGARSALLEERGDSQRRRRGRMRDRALPPRCCTTSGTIRSRTRSRRSARCTTRRSRAR